MTDSPRNEQTKNEGEGNRSADRRYREGVRQHVESGAPEAAGEEAERALEGAEGDDLRKAEAEGKAKKNR
jgi:hypothetical protein